MILYRLFLIFVFVTLCSAISKAQSEVQPQPNPTLMYVAASDSVGPKTVPLGEAISGEAPLTVICDIGVEDDSIWRYSSEWIVYDLKESTVTPYFRRLLGYGEKQTKFVFLKESTYDITLKIVFYKKGETPEDPYEVGTSTVDIEPASLKCFTAFSPNDDGTNDYLYIECSSIVSLTAMVFNRWGQRVATCDLEQAQNNPHNQYKNEKNYYVIWDGKIGGRPAKDGAYFLNLQALGSNGVVYKEKKTISVLKGYKDPDETDGSNINN